jgi:hypothetical protein
MTSEPDVAREDDQNPRAGQAMVAETVKQAVYTIALIGAGVAMFRAGRRSCEKPGGPENSCGLPTSNDCDRDRTGNVSDFDELP